MLNKIGSFFLLIILFQACSLSGGKGKTVADEYFQPLINNYITVSSSSESSSNNLKKGFYYYQKGAYQDALDTFNKSNTVGNPRLKLYMAVSQIELKRYTQAEQMLESLIVSHRFEHADVAYWYLALTYLYEERIPSAEAIFQAFATREKGSYKQADSAIVLEKLEK